MNTHPTIACIGECMIELSSIDLDQGRARVGFAGDTFNTAIYLARLRPGVSYVSNLGHDGFSGQMLRVMADEGIDAGLVGLHASRLPGLYSIEVDATGERSFRYWRDSSAARTLFQGVGATFDDLARFDTIYLSGITLAILPADIRAALTARLADLRATGHRIVFDSNYRPRLWPDADTARAAFAAIWAATTLALPSLDDESALHPGTTPGAVLDRLSALGVTEIALKNGAAGPLIRADGHDIQVSLPRAPRVVDTTGAGDSFNAGYLAARLDRAAPGDAAAAGHRLAMTVIAHPGAVIPRAAMPAQD